MARLIVRVLLAAAIGFGVYRFAVAVVPGDDFGSALTQCADGSPRGPKYDFVTGIPIGIVVTCPNASGVVAVQDSIPMTEHWLRALLVGLAGAGLALLVLLWVGRISKRGVGHASSL